LLYENINANFCLTLNEFLPAYSIKRNMINQSKTKHMSIKRKFICQCLFFEIEIGIEGRGLKVIIMRRDEAFIHVYVAGDDTIVHIRQLIFTGDNQEISWRMCTIVSSPATYT
jgi:hypothetical protein